MYKLSIPMLISALNGAEAFKMPEMTEGARYLFDELYLKMAGGGEVFVRDLDFSRFGPDDIRALYSLYENVVEDGNRRANYAIDRLRAITPARFAVSFA